MIPGLAAGNTGSSGGIDTGDIGHSLRFRGAQYLSKTLSAPTSNTGWALSVWLKQGKLGVSQSLFGASTTELYVNDQNQLAIYKAGSVATSSALLRDPISPIHLLFTSNGTVVKGYRNNVEVLSYTGTLPHLNSAIAHTIGKYAASASDYLDGYLSRYAFVDGGGSLTPGDFAYLNTEINEWVSKTQSAVKTVVDAGGTNSFMLDFNDATSLTTLGNDYSSKNNDWTLNNFSLTAGTTYDHMLDVPGNSFATLNPLNKGLDQTITDGNLTLAMGSGASYTPTLSSFGMTSGKWWWAFKVSASNVSPTSTTAGILNTTMNSSVSSGTGYFPGDTAAGWGYAGSGLKWNNGASSAYGASYASTDSIAFEFDADAGSLRAYKQTASSGSWVDQGVMFSGLAAGTYFPAFGETSGVNTSTINVNHGQQETTFVPTTGFKALCQANLPDVATSLLNPTDHHIDITVTKSGDTNFTLPWDASVYDTFFEIKQRNGNGDWYQIDGLRGYTKILKSNSTAAETTDANVLGISGTTGTLKSTLANGTYIVSATKAGLSASRQTNTDGSITSTVSRNVDSGFAIVTYTGNGGVDATIGHGLGVAPKLFIIKNRTSAVDWPVYHKSLPSHDGGNYPANSLRLNTTGAVANTLGLWSAPTSTVIYLGDGQLSAGNRPLTNTNGSTYVAYCFADSAIQKSFSYSGNASADGPYVNLGFKCGRTTLKRTDVANDWATLDSVRDTYNVAKAAVFYNSSSSETANGFYDTDIDSNSLKVRATNAVLNASGGTYIGHAWAATTGKYSLAR